MIEPLVAVDDHLIAAGDVAQKRADADDRRQFQRLGDDRGVAARTADFGDESEDELAIEIRGFAGRQVVRQDDGRRGEARKPLAAAAQQMPQQPLFDIEDVAGPVGQPAMLHVLKDFGIAAQRAADGIFGRVVPIADHALQFAPQLGIAEHLQMGVEDGGVLIAQFARHRFAIALDFGAGGRDRFVRGVPARPRPIARRTAGGCGIPRCRSPTLRRSPRPAKRQFPVVAAWI